MIKNFLIKNKKYVIIGGVIIAIGGLIFIPPMLKFGADNDGTSVSKMIEKYNNSDKIKEKYTIDGVRLKTTPKDNPKDRIDVWIGEKSTNIFGADTTTFNPRLTIARWDSEVEFSVMPTTINEIPLKDRFLTFDNEKIILETPKVLYKLYELPVSKDLPEGGYEYEIDLLEKPNGNIITFDLDSDGVKFTYQRPLNIKYQNGYSDEFKEEIVVSETEVKDLDGNVLASIPENVVGSYTIYTIDKKINWEGDKEYKIGKVGQIYRPKISDSAGKEIWGILKIEKGIMSVEIAQEFLDKATYPVFHATGSTFGYTSIGSGGYGLGIGDFAGATNTLSENGLVTQITAYWSNANKNTGAGMYIDATDDLLFAQTASVSTSASTTPTNYVTDVEISSGNYWIVVESQSDLNPIKNDDPGATPDDYIFDGFYPGLWRYTWTGSQVYNTWSIYATYTATGREVAFFLASSSWTAPTGVTSAEVACWGGGGGGFDDTSGTNSGAGGGGGAFASSSVALTPTVVYSVSVGASVSENTTGNDSTFVADDKTVLADAGTGATSATANGVGGTTANSTGDVESAGGAGGDAVTTGDTGGGGGGAGGSDGTGGTGSNGEASIGGAGGIADNTKGGIGGHQGDTNAGGTGGGGFNGGGGGGGGDNGTSGGNGGIPGGGGAGGETDGGFGAYGMCYIVWTTEAPPAAEEGGRKRMW